jgi:hypothetical protein
MGLKEELTALYDRDFYEWTQRNSELLSQGCIHEADVLHIAEEIRDMGERDKREVRSRLAVLITHLLKWQFQPQFRHTESGSSSWLASINEQRNDLSEIFDQSGSLERAGRSDLARVYRQAAKQASIETGIPASRFPTECPYSFDQIIDHEFLPA